MANLSDENLQAAEARAHAANPGQQRRSLDEIVLIADLHDATRRARTAVDGCACDGCASMQREGRLAAALRKLRWAVAHERDSEALRLVTPAALEAWLAAHGWREHAAAEGRHSRSYARIRRDPEDWLVLVPKGSARAFSDYGRAIGHVQSVLASFAPQHDHKMAGAAWLCSLWFEPLGTATYTPPERAPLAPKPAPSRDPPKERTAGKTERGAARRARRSAAHLGGHRG